MRIPLLFTYPVEYLKIRARTPAQECFLSETSVTIAEISSTDAPSVIRIERPSRSGPDRHEDFVLHDGRLFRALRRPDTKAIVDIDAWCADLMDPAGSHTAKKNGTRDILRLWPRGQGFGHRPVRRPEDVEIAEMVEDGRDETISDIETAAASVIIRDGQVFHQTTEPFWLLRSPHTTADAKLKTIRLDIVDLQESWEAIPVNAVPFMEYRKFRLDRFDEAMECWGALAAKLSPAKIQPKDTFDTFSSDCSFRFDAAGAMLFELLDDLSGTAGLAVTCVRGANRFRAPETTLDPVVDEIAAFGSLHGTRPTEAEDVADKLRWIAGSVTVGWPVPGHPFFELKLQRCLSMIPTALGAYERSRATAMTTKSDRPSAPTTSAPKTHPFTVVVLAPKRLQRYETDAPPVAYAVHVKASNAALARRSGAMAAMERWPRPEERGDWREWLPVVVFDGHAEPTAWGWEGPKWTI